MTSETDLDPATNRALQNQTRWGPEYEDTLFSGGMLFSDEGRVVENKMMKAVLEQGGFVAAFTGKWWFVVH